MCEKKSPDFRISDRVVTILKIQNKDEKKRKMGQKKQTGSENLTKMSRKFGKK